MYELEYRETTIGVYGDHHRGCMADDVNDAVKDSFDIYDITVSRLKTIKDRVTLTYISVLTLIDTGDTLQEIEDLIIDKYF